MENEKVKVHLMFMGDKGVGKTSLILTSTTNAFPGTFTPEVVRDVNSVNKKIEGHSVEIACHDYDHEKNEFFQPSVMSGRDAKQKKAALKEFESEPKAYIACFSVVSPPSFDDIQNWMHKAEGHPSIIVGLKTDLREDLQTLQNLQSKKMAPTCEAQGKHLVAQFAFAGCAKYLECSAEKGRNVEAVFTEATKFALNAHAEKHGKEKCIIC